MRRRILPLLATTATVVFAVAMTPAAAAPGTPAAPAALPDSSAYGTYFPQSPTRLLDTRAAGGAALGPGGSVTVTPAVVDGVLPNAIVVNLTAVAPTSGGYLTAYPTQTERPVVSSVNFAARRTIANLVTVKVGPDGKFVVTNGFGTTHVVVDQLGVYTGVDTRVGGRGGGYQPLLDGPQRTLDTRSDGAGQIPNGFYIKVPFRYSGTNSGAPIAALALNLTVANPRGTGFITTWDAASNVPPKASTLNFTAGQTVANSAIVPTSHVGQDAIIGIYNGSTGPVDVVVDVVGFFDDGESLTAPIRFEPLDTPVRIVDSRSGSGLRPIGSDGRDTFTAPASVLGSTAGPTVGLDANLTLVAPTAPTYLTLWPQTGTLDKPRTSNVNAAKGQVVANHVFQELGPENGVNVYNYRGTANVVVDVGGRFVRIDGESGAGKASPGSRLTVGAPTEQPAATPR